MTKTLSLKPLDLFVPVQLARRMEAEFVSEEGKYLEPSSHCPPLPQEDPKKAFLAIVASSPFRLSSWKEHFYASPEQKALNREVTDRVYNEHNIYRTEPWDMVPGHLALKAIRAGLRFVAPETMEAAVATDHPDIERQILLEKCPR